eukprot:gene184-194_t
MPSQTAKPGYVPPSLDKSDLSQNADSAVSQGIPMTEEGEGKVKDFIPSKGLTEGQARELLLKWGRNELEDKKKAKVKSFVYVQFSEPC